MSPISAANPIHPQSTVGILGGGQLGRMLAAAALRMGYHTAVFAPEPDPPAGECATHLFTNSYEDETALKKFAAHCDVVTLEFENVPVSAVNFLSDTVPVRPGAAVLQVTQDRIREKSFFNTHQIPTADWRALEDEHALEACRDVFPSAVLKTARDGYDGKGQWRLTPDSALPTITAPAIVEETVDFTKEISVLIARGMTGETVHYSPVHNLHRDHILHQTFAPADIDAGLADEAVALARRIITALNMVGLLAVEMFVTIDNRLLVNELAPRAHNSGHWSMDGANICQFELLLRAICGLPLMMPQLRFPTEMVNLLGADIGQCRDYLENPDARLYHYGKAETRPGRKMGHVNIVKTS